MCTHSLHPLPRTFRCTNNPVPACPLPPPTRKAVTPHTKNNNNHHNAWHSIKPNHCSADLVHGSARQRHLVLHGGGIGSSSYTVVATVLIHHGGIRGSSSYAAASTAAHLSIQQAISGSSFTTAASAAARTNGLRVASFAA